MQEKKSVNKPLRKSVVFHKIVERRLDSVAGGAVGALLETFMKDEGYFCAPVYDEHHHLTYILTNDSSRIEDVVDDCQFDVAVRDQFGKIKELLAESQQVFFIGTPCACKELYNSLGGSNSSLIMMELLCNGISEDALIDKYVNELEEKYGDEVKSLRFHDKEFPYYNSKRIQFSKGNTVYIYDKEPFDDLLDKKVFLKEKCAKCQLCSMGCGIADISHSVYDRTYKIGDHLGYSAIVVNSEDGLSLYEKTLRRLETYKEGSEVKDDYLYNGIPNNKRLSVGELERNSITNCCSQVVNSSDSIVNRLKHFIRLCRQVKIATRLHPGPLYKFFKYNFFRKNTRTDYKNMGYIFVYPYSEFNFDKSAVIELHGPLFMGAAKRVASSRLETRLWMRKNSKLEVHRQCIFAFGGDVEIFENAVLNVGDLVTANPFTIICGERIDIGTPVNIAKGTEVRDTNSHLLSVNGFKLNRPITIGNHVWIASNCNIMPGSKIGDGCVIAGVSYLNRKVPSFTIAEGHPAEVKSDIKYFRM